MKSDQTFEKVWTREGVIYYQLKKNEYVCAQNYQPVRRLSNTPIQRDGH